MNWQIAMPSIEVIRTGFRRILKIPECVKMLLPCHFRVKSDDVKILIIPECEKYHDHERQKEADEACHRCQIWIDPGYAGHVKDDDRVVDENVEATELEGGHQSQAEGQLPPMRTQR